MTDIEHELSKTDWSVELAGEKMDEAIHLLMRHEGFYRKNVRPYSTHWKAAGALVTWVIFDLGWDFSISHDNWNAEHNPEYRWEAVITPGARRGDWTCEGFGEFKPLAICRAVLNIKDDEQA